MFKQRNSTNLKIGGMSSARKPPIIGGIPSHRKTKFFGMPEIFDFPAHQKPSESEANQIMPPISDGCFLTYALTLHFYSIQNTNQRKNQGFSGLLKTKVINNS
ncbi:hypothetical protein JYT91_00610 [archaeon AH-315-M20]|nr:hypothetical protein [archaeon AH-315-M20]